MSVSYLLCYFQCECLCHRGGIKIFLSYYYLGLKELKVFVDLASISAGEGDMEVAKVKCLHAATTGYAPLIFNLDDQCDYNKFLEQCKLVWKELKADPDLPLKLVRKIKLILYCHPRI